MSKYVFFQRDSYTILGFQILKKKHPLLIRAAEKQAGKNMQNRHPPFVNVHILLRRRFALETRRGYPSRSAKGMLMTLSAMRCLSGSLSEKKTCWSMFERL